MSSLQPHQTCERCKEITQVFCIVKRNLRHLLCGFCIEDGDFTVAIHRYHLSPDEWDSKKEAIRKYVGLRPGYYNTDRLKNALNLGDVAITDLLIELRDEIRLVPMAFADPSKRVNIRLYLDKDAPRNTKQRQRMTTIAQPVETVVDPLLVGAWKPNPDQPRGSTKFLLSQQQLDGRPMRQHHQIIELCEQVLAEFLEAGQPFNKQDFCDRTKLSSSRFYSDRYRSIRLKVEQAMRDLSNPDTTTPQLNPEIVAESPPDLEQRVQELEARNRELRAQLAERETTTQVVQVAMPLSWLQEQAENWRRAIANYQQEQEQISADIAAAQANLAACERLIELHQVEAPIGMTTITTAVNAATNGHRAA